VNRYHFNPSQPLRRFIAMLVLLSALQPLQAQQPSLRLVSAAGGFIQSAQGSVSFSIGEPVIGTLTGGGFTIHQGFQQPETGACTIEGFNPFTALNLSSRLDSLRLDAGTSYSRYVWSTGETTSSIQAKFTGGYKVTVTSAEGCTGTDSVYVQFPDTVGFHVSSVRGLCDRAVEVPVKATQFRYLLTMQGSVAWPAADLKFDEVSGFGPASLGLNESNFGLTKTSSGQLSFSWNDPNGAGLLLPDSTTVFTLRFIPQGTTQRTVAVTVSNTPTPLEVYDGGLVKKSLSLTAGAVQIACEFTIIGKVLTPTEHGVKDVVVALSGGVSPASATTDKDGNYSFKVLPGTYTLTPVKTYEKNKTNGVTTLDAALIQAHILGRIPFNAAYKLIAADVNNSSSVTTADILYLRRLLLAMDTTLPNNRIWAFVDGDQTFTTPAQAFPFRSTKTFTNQSTDVSHLFRGIKIGDVNYDRNPQLEEGPAADTLRLYYTWTDGVDGSLVLRLLSKEVKGLMGWQTTLSWDAQKLQLLGVTPMMNNLGTGDRWKEEGKLMLSWNDPRAEGVSTTDGMAWVELTFRKTDRLDRTQLGLTEEKLVTEVFNSSYQRMALRMQSAEIRGNVWEGSMRVYPNPAGQVVHVEWKSARRGEATVRVLDATGRVVYLHRGMYEAGVQRHRIQRDEAMVSAGSCLVQVEVEGVVRSQAVVLAGQAPRP